MKKKVVVVLLLLLFSGNVLFANNFESGRSIMGSSAVGATVCATMAVLGYGDGWWWGVGGFGAFFLFGIIWTCIPDSDEYAMIKEDPILQHVSFGATDKQVYLGAHFSY